MKTITQLSDRVDELQRIIDNNIDAAEAGSLSAQITIVSAEEMKEEIADEIDRIAMDAFFSIETN